MSKRQKSNISSPLINTEAIDLHRSPFPGRTSVRVGVSSFRRKIGYRGGDVWLRFLSLVVD